MWIFLFIIKTLNSFNRYIAWIRSRWISLTFWRGYTFYSSYWCCWLDAHSLLMFCTCKSCSTIVISFTFFLKTYTINIILCYIVALRSISFQYSDYRSICVHWIIIIFNFFKRSKIWKWWYSLWLDIFLFDWW
jgi:hypothetical protein